MMDAPESTELGLLANGETGGDRGAPAVGRPLSAAMADRIGVGVETVMLSWLKWSKGAASGGDIRLLISQGFFMSGAIGDV